MLVTRDFKRVPNFTTSTPNHIKVLYAISNGIKNDFPIPPINEIIPPAIIPIKAPAKTKGIKRPSSSGLDGVGRALSRSSLRCRLSKIFKNFKTLDSNLERSSSSSPTPNNPEIFLKPPIKISLAPDIKFLTSENRLLIPEPKTEETLLPTVEEILPNPFFTSSGIESLNESPIPVNDSLIWFVNWKRLLIPILFILEATDNILSYISKLSLLASSKIPEFLLSASARSLLKASRMPSTVVAPCSRNLSKIAWVCWRSLVDKVAIILLQK